MKFKLLPTGIVVASLALAGGISLWLVTANNDQPELARPERAGIVANIGEQVTLDGVSGFTVTSFDCDKPELLDRTCQLEFELQNLGENSYLPNSCDPYFGDQIELFDSQGTNYTTGDQRAGVCLTVIVDFPQGDSLEQQMDFEIPGSAIIEGAVISGDRFCREIRAESSQSWTEDCHYSRQAWVYFQPVISTRPETTPKPKVESHFQPLANEQTGAIAKMGQPLVMTELSFAVTRFNCRQLSIYLDDDPSSDGDQLIDQAAGSSWLGVHARNLRDQLETTGSEVTSLADEFRRRQSCELAYSFDYSGEATNDYSSCRPDPTATSITHRLVLVDAQDNHHLPHPNYFCPGGFEPGSQRVHEKAWFYLPSQRQPEALIFQGNHQCRSQSAADSTSCTYTATNQGRVNLPERTLPCFANTSVCYLPDDYVID